MSPNCVFDASLVPGTCLERLFDLKGLINKVLESRITGHLEYQDVNSRVSVNQDLTEPAGNRITYLGTPLLAWSGSLDSVRLPRLAFLSSWESSSSTGPMSYLTRRAGTIPCRIFLTLLACATLAGAQQNPENTQSPQESAAPSSPNTQAAAPSQSQDEKHIYLRVIDTPFPQSPIFPSGAATTSDASGAGSQDRPSSESKCELVFAPIPFSNQALTWGIIPVAQYFFPASEGDSTSPRSFVAGFGMVADGINSLIMPT